MENITEGIMEFKSLEKTIFTVMCQVACQMVTMYLQTWDKIIMARRNTNEYRLVATKKTHIHTLMGKVVYRRAYYHKASGGYVYLLDEAMGIGDGYGAVSENLTEKILVECSDKSYRKAAGSISSHTGHGISRMGAWNVVQEYGERVKAREERLKELDSEGTVGLLGNISSKVLFGEFDDVWLTMQRGTRRKAGTQAEKGRKRIGMKPMHVGTAYTGWSKREVSSYAMINKFAYAGFSDSSDFISMFETLLRQRFDMDGVERLIVNGDGEAWIKTIADNNDAILQLDPFHKSQAIMRAVKDKDERKRINDALREKDVEKAIDGICTLITNSSDEPMLKKLEALATYFDSNKDYLLPWQERGIAMPAPPEGVYYRNMGTQEHSNCDLITLRMKHRKGAWSPDGANNMARILCLRATIGLDAMLGVLPEPSGVAWIPTEPLSAAKAPQHDGKGDDATWLYAGMPFAETFVTSGREAIQSLLKQRPLSELRYI